MANTTTALREIASSNAHGRPSTREEQAEFLHHLQTLGIRPHGRARPDGTQTVRCWRRDKHSHGDRTPSLDVNPGKCLFHCHGCGIGGGLVQMRKATGWTPTRSGRNRARLAAIEALADFGSDPLEYVPENVLETLRARTGRYKKDRTVTRHLRTMIAAAVQMFHEAEQATGFVFSQGVRFTAADAHARGILPAVFSDFLPLLKAVGFTVEVGESGRQWAHKAAQTDDGYLVATKLGLSRSGLSRRNVNRHEVLTQPTYLPLPTIHIPHKPRTDAVIAARLATKCETKRGEVRTWASLRQSPALADLLLDLATFEKVREAADGSTCQPGSRFIWDLVNTHGPNVPRTIRTAERAGLVTVWRDVKQGPKARAGFVTLTDMGAHVVERDVEKGRARMEAEAEQIRAKWRKYLADRKEAVKIAREKARAEREQHGERDRWEHEYALAG